MGTNLINTKGNNFQLIRRRHHEPRIQVLMEFVKNPRYIFYVHHQDPEIMEKLEAFVSEKKCVYTPCLGLSQLICDFSHLGTFDATFVESKDLLEISTPIKTTLLLKTNGSPESPIFFENGKRYVKELLPIKMRPDRVVEEYSEVIYEENGKSIKARVKRAYKIHIHGHDEYITFF
jgi:CRISPR-associated protein Cas5h